MKNHTLRNARRFRKKTTRKRRGGNPFSNTNLSSTSSSGSSSGSGLFSNLGNSLSNLWSKSKKAVTKATGMNSLGTKTSSGYSTLPPLLPPASQSAGTKRRHIRKSRRRRSKRRHSRSGPRRHHSKSHD